MYSTPNQPIPQENILKSFLGELESAVLDADMFNVAERTSVYEALDYIQKERPYLRNKCVIFREVLENHTEFQPLQLKMAYLDIVKMVDIEP